MLMIKIISFKYLYVDQNVDSFWWLSVSSKLQLERKKLCYYYYACTTNKIKQNAAFNLLILLLWLLALG